MPDATYGQKVYRKQGGDELVVANGGKITVEAGGKIYGTSLLITEGIQGVTAATATNYGLIFIAPFPVQVVSVSEIHTVAGNRCRRSIARHRKINGYPGACRGRLSFSGSNKP